MGICDTWKKSTVAHVAAATRFGRVCLSQVKWHEMKGVGHDIGIWRSVMVFLHRLVCRVYLALRTASADQPA